MTSPPGSHGRPRHERAGGRACGAAVEGQMWSSGGVAKGRACSCGRGTAGHHSVWRSGASDEKREMQGAVFVGSPLGDEGEAGGW